MRSLAFAIILPAVLSGCQSVPDSTPRSRNGFYHAVIETPAGEIPSSQSASDFRYLTPPFNLAYVPGTIVKHPASEETKPVGVILISERRELGETVEIRPLGLLKASDRPGWSDRVIAVPLDPARGMSGEVQSFFDLQRKCLTCVKIIYEWTLNQPPAKEVVFRGWGTELEAEQFIVDHIKSVSAR